jgi:hypothetical protein
MAGHLAATRPAARGSRVQLQHINMKPHLNGKQGVAGEWDGQFLQVSVLGLDPEIKVRPCKLSLACHCAQAGALPRGQNLAEAQPVHRRRHTQRRGEAPAQRPEARPEARPEEAPAQRPEARPEEAPAQRPEARPEEAPAQRPAQAWPPQHAQHPQMLRAEQRRQPARTTSRASVRNRAGSIHTASFAASGLQRSTS